MPAKYAKPVNTTQTATVYKAALDSVGEVCFRTAGAFAPSQTDTPSMAVRVEAGPLFVGTTLTELAAQTTGVIAAPTTNPRIDRVVKNKTTGAISVVTGTEAASPVAPAITSGCEPICQVALSVGQTVITNANITDERLGGGAGVTVDTDSAMTANSDLVVPSQKAVKAAITNLGLNALASLALTANTIPYTGASGTPQQLALGSAGQVLISQGSSSAPIFATMSEWEWTFVSKATASSSSSLDFTGLDFTTYDYKLVLNKIVTSSNYAAVRVGTGSTPTWVATNYYASNQDVVYNALTTLSLTDASVSSTAWRVAPAISHINGRFTIQYDSGNSTCDFSGERSHSGNAWGIVGGIITSIAAAPTAIRFLCTGGTVTSGTVALYRRVKK